MMNLLKIEFVSILHCVRDLLLLLLPNDWLTCRFVRPNILRLMGMKIARKCNITKSRYFGSLKNIKIGHNAYINREVFIHCGGKVHLGNNVGVGYRVVFVTGHHEIGPSEHRWGTLSRRDIVVEDGVWICSNAFIGPGVTIGAGSIVAAGAVVISSIPANTLVGGVPAKVIKEL